MTHEHQHSSQHKDVLKKKSLERNEVKEVLDLIKKYGVPTLIAVVVVSGIFLFDRYLKSSKATKEAAADTALMNARSPEDFQNILDEYGSTSSAPIAMMSLAMSEFIAGDYDAAQATYGKFVKEYGKHDMAPQAELNQISCRESKGELSEAHLLYGKFASKHKDSYLAPVAMMGQARCLESMGNSAEAKRAYEDLIVAYPGSDWANLADTRMTVINSKLK